MPMQISGVTIQGGMNILPAGGSPSPAPAPGPSDPNFPNVTFMFDGDGSNAANNNTFTDGSSNGYTVTESGSVIQGSVSPYGDNWSNYFGVASSVVASDSAIAMGTGDWTLEFWVYFNAVNNGTIKYLFDMRTGADTTNSFLAQESSNIWTWWNGSGSSLATDGLTTSTFSAGTWHHVALSRNGSTVKLFVDGVTVNSPTDSSNYNSTSITIGNRYSGSYGIDGYISNVRIVKGTALYTSDFTPPTDPLTAITNTQLLTCQSNRFADNSTNYGTVTVGGTPKVTPFSPFKDDDARDMTTDGGSAHFDSNEYLTIADNANLDVSGAMTAECWVYITDMPDNNIGSVGQGYLINRWTASGDQRSWAFLYGNNGNVAFYSSSNGGASYTISTATGALSTYRWTHVAASWDGTNQRLFIDGDLKVTTANASGPYSTPNSGVTVNAINTSLTGTNNKQYIADARYFRDAAIYISNFTPPTAPLTATSGSDTAAVLLNFQDAGIYDYTGINNLDTVGNAQIDTSVKKYGTGSVKFDGTGDYLDIPGSADLNFGSGDFTIEFWLNINSTGTQAITDPRSSDNDIVPLIWVQQGSGGIYYYTNGANAILGSTVLSTGQWYHVALARNGNTTTLYLDGTSEGAFTDTLTYIQPTMFRIGQRYTGTAFNLDGYLDDFRITKGLARYTSNFTPPTEALPKF